MGDIPPDSKIYHFIYKTTCIINNKYYIGLHSTKNINDNYLGSGLILKQAIRNYGKENFKKEIIEYCNTREELKTREKEIITTEMLNDPMCYNIIEGGEANAGQYVWNSKHASEIKKRFSEMNTGYRNFDFINRWKPIYDKVSVTFIKLKNKTNLPDIVCRDIACNESQILVKLANLRQYLKTTNQLFYKEQTKNLSFITTSPLPIIQIYSHCCQFPLIIQGLQKKFLEDYDDVIKVLLDNDISDSMIYNNLLNLSFGKGISGRLSYYKHLNLIKETGETNVKIKNKLPDSIRKKSIKTTYQVLPEEIENKILLEKIYDTNTTTGTNYNFYRANYNGKSFQFTRIRLEDITDK